MSPDGRTVTKEGGREGDVFYRDRWSHDKVVRSTHGVNCTGSCSWKVYVKDGIITWETQQTDYPSVGPGPPRVRAPRLPPRRGVLLVHLLAHPGPLPVRPRRPGGDVPRGQGSGSATRCWPGPTSSPTASAAAATSRPAARAAWCGSTWDEATEMIAAAHVHTIKKYGPDRVAGFSPIPAMSMVSHAAGARFIELIGGAMTSFYDWYADLPVASPQVFGDQTDVPESGDWWDAVVPDHVGLERPGHPHPGRALDGRGPLPRRQGRHGQPGLRRQHEVRRRVDALRRRAPTGRWRWRWATSSSRSSSSTGGCRSSSTTCSSYTDLPFLVKLEERRDGGFTPGHQPDRGRPRRHRRGRGLQDRCCSTAATASRWCRTARSASATATPAWASGTSTSSDVAPVLTVARRRRRGRRGRAAALRHRRRHRARSCAAACRCAGSAGTWSRTVFDLMLAQYGVAREGCPASGRRGYDDVEHPYTPAWQEPSHRGAGRAGRPGRPRVRAATPRTPAAGR